MDAILKQLDVLMGANHNGDVTEVNCKNYDRDVCRLYLSGLCPHDLFQLTFSKDKRSILPVGDITEIIHDEDADVAVLEEPEHLTW